APIWDAPRKAALLDALGAVEAHGLPAARYDVDALSTLLSDAETPVDMVELAAGRMFLKYARDVSSGLLEPRQVDRDIVIRPPRPDEATLLMDLADSTDIPAFFKTLAPADKQYARLQAEKIRLEAIISAGGWGESVPSGKSLKPGQTAERVVALRARLGSINGADYGSDPIFDEALTDIVKAFQEQNGLNDDGVVGPKTLEAVNASAADRLRQVLVNLERQRWLNVERGDRHIFVNQADFSVSVVDDGEVTFWSRTVIGKNKHKTQEFNDTMTHMVVNPTWHVPRSITTEEMLPKLKRNPGALGSSFQVMTRNGTRVNPRFVNFNQFSAGNFPFIVKQKPGGANALGRVKFMFPNQFNIYLHDTPSKSLFNRDARAYSHGCVRVQKPFELAHTLLAPQSDDPEGLFSSVLARGNERRINLETPVPI
ncbi:MAG: L,D-transpeptidase family protein, partial [Pseudomonadota bacterium]